MLLLLLSIISGRCVWGDLTETENLSAPVFPYPILQPLSLHNDQLNLNPTVL